MVEDVVDRDRPQQPALGEMPTRDYLDEELEGLRAELERLRKRVGSDPGDDVRHRAAADRDRPA